ncbi:MAG: type VI secretion protein [Pseudomonadaceae bacterium]|nr:MAG: type VI secretion protein [Pseudomonadaceae bacterium]
MTIRLCTAILLLLTGLAAGCGGNYKMSDSDYRPLGEPPAKQSSAR